MHTWAATLTKPSPYRLLLPLITFTIVPYLDPQHPAYSGLFSLEVSSARGHCDSFVMLLKVQVLVAPRFRFF
ncbi:hypothetical protein HD806DRAFT_478646, partial [Xylariaceae sp. AK1471]